MLEITDDRLRELSRPEKGGPSTNAIARELLAARAHLLRYRESAESIEARIRQSPEMIQSLDLIEARASQIQADTRTVGYDSGIPHVAALAREIESIVKDSLKLGLVRLCERVAQLEAAVANQCADNLCFMKTPEDFAAGAILPEAEFLESCRRFHNQQRAECGELTARTMTIAQLEAEILRLTAHRDAVERLAADVEAISTYQQLPALDAAKEALARYREAVKS